MALKLQRQYHCHSTVDIPRVRLLVDGTPIQYQGLVHHKPKLPVLCLLLL